MSSPLPTLRALAVAAAPLALLACTDKADSGDSTCEPDAPAGAATATLDGSPWAVDAAWSWSGDSLQVTTSAEGGWRMTLVAHRGPDGSAMSELAESGGLPVTLDLSSDDAWVTLYPDAGGTSLTTKSGDGTLTLVEAGEADGSGAWTGCFSGEAATSDGAAAVSFTAGELHATGG